MEEKKLIFIPEYLQKAISAKGKYFSLVTSNIDTLVASNKIDQVPNYLSSLISKYDMEDLYAVNDLIFNYLDLTEDILLLPINKSTEQNRSNILSILTDNTVETEKVILSSYKDSSVNVPFSIMDSNTTVYVILQNGFFNFFVLNTFLKFKYWFLNILIKHYFKVHDNEVKYKTSLFRQYNYLAYLKYVD